jgi:hypothetical protein
MRSRNFEPRWSLKQESGGCRQILQNRRDQRHLLIPCFHPFIQGISVSYWQYEGFMGGISRRSEGRNTTDRAHSTCMHQNQCSFKMGSPKENSLTYQPGCFLSNWQNGLNLRLQVVQNLEEAVVHCPVLRNGLGQRDALDLRPAQHNQPSKLALVDQIDGCQPVAGGQHAVVG